LKNILIVDDESEVCDFLSEFFEERGFSTNKAGSSEETLKQLEVKQPEYCILDIKMPGVSGIELLKTIKFQYPETRVVMLTALDNRELVEQALKLGAENYLVKPINLDSLDKLFSKSSTV
jgi:two-component system, response regulator, stage 0 sporulation protein F